MKVFLTIFARFTLKRIRIQRAKSKRIPPVFANTLFLKFIFFVLKRVVQLNLNKVDLKVEDQDER